MDFETTPEQEAFRAELRGWLDDNLPDGWTEGDRDVPEDFEERIEFLKDWQYTLYEGGWAGLAWPEEYGGRDATLMEQVIFDMETARVDSPPEVNHSGLGLIGPTLIQTGTEEQKERFLEPILTAEEIWCQGYSEPDAGSDLASLQTSAEDHGDEFVINGQKIWTSGGHFADWCFLLARTDDTGNKHQGITVFLVDMDQPGVSTEPIRGIGDEHHFNQLFFDDAVAKREHVVGDIDDGWSVAMTLSGFERTTSLVFHLERRWKEVVRYCQTHDRDGRPLSEDPAVRRRLADFDARIQGAKLTYLRNISRRIKAGHPTSEGLMDNVYGRELKQEFERFATGLKGRRAGVWEDGSVSDSHPLYPLWVAGMEDGWWTEQYLGSFGLTVGGGTSDIKRNLIGERVLDLPKGLRTVSE